MKEVMSILEVEPWITRQQWQCKISHFYQHEKNSNPASAQLVHIYWFSCAVYTEFRLIFSSVHCLQGVSRVFEVGILSPYGILGQCFGKYNDFLMHAQGEKKGIGSSLSTNSWHCISYWSLAVKFRALVSGM